MKTSRFNKFGVFSLLLLIATIGSSCSYYNRIMARMNLVDGAQAYNARNFDEATEKFRKAVEYDPARTTSRRRVVGMVGRGGCILAIAIGQATNHRSIIEIIVRGRNDFAGREG